MKSHAAIGVIRLSHPPNLGAQRDVVEGHDPCRGDVPISDRRHDVAQHCSISVPALRLPIDPGRNQGVELEPDIAGSSLRDASAEQGRRRQQHDADGDLCREERRPDAHAGLGVDTWQVGRDVKDPGGEFTAGVGISAEGAILVRPDGFVAWRSEAAQPDPYASMRAAFATSLAWPAPPA